MLEELRSHLFCRFIFCLHLSWYSISSSRAETEHFVDHGCDGILILDLAYHFALGQTSDWRTVNYFMPILVRNHLPQAFLDDVPVRSRFPVHLHYKHGLEEVLIKMVFMLLVSTVFLYCHFLILMAACSRCCDSLACLLSRCLLLFPDPPPLKPTTRARRENNLRQ